MPVTSRTFAITQAIDYEMQKNPYMVYSNQNAIGAATRSDGKTLDFLAEFGLDRALARFGQGIDEEWMSGSTIAYALTQIGPAVVQCPAMTTQYPAELFFNHAGSWRYASGGQVDKVAVVVWMGGSGRGAKSDYIHAQSGNEVVYASYHGVVCVVPHKVYDCKGMMAAAIQSNRPTMYYNYSTEASADIPDEPYVVPIGKANIITEGTDITIATYGSVHPEVAKAVPLLATAGIKAEYFDTRTLKPFDEATLVASVKKTGRLLAVSQGNYHAGFTSHILAVAAQEVPGAKFRMITFPDNPSPGAATMINWLKPDSAKIVDAAQKVMKL
jgi:pyruvate/2-oxoglutarate/acetoin dehydrogenase E1 component